MELAKTLKKREVTVCAKSLFAFALLICGIAIIGGCAVYDYVELPESQAIEGVGLQSESQALEDSKVSDDILSRRWPNGVVPYTCEVVLDIAYTDTPYYPRWFDAKNRWRTLTEGAVRFVPRTDETPYIHIIFDGGNATRKLRGTKEIVSDSNGDIVSASGVVLMRTISGKRDINIRTRDLYKTNHELGHVLGLFHQQRHPDSGLCVDMKPGKGGRIHEKYFIGGYSQGSIMHYLECDPADARCKFSRWDSDPVDCPSTRGWHEPPSDFDVLTILKMYGANGEYLNDTAWCSENGQRLYMGDFNGDGLDDLLCHAQRGGVDEGARSIDHANDNPDDVYGDGDWTITSNIFCRSLRRSLYVGDFNGDGRDDLLCHDREDGSRFIDSASCEGTLGGTDSWPGGTFCWGGNRQLYIGDFDGDGKDDQLCHNKTLGTRSIDYADNGFNGMDWMATDGWCKRDSRSLVVGDFSGDGRDDLLCHDIDSGDRWIDYANRSGELRGADWSSKGDDQAYRFCWGGNQTVYAADVDGNGRDDLICHNRYLGSISVDYATSSTWSEGSRLWGADSFREISFCNAQDAHLLIGNLPKDATSDSLFCHNRATGHQAARYDYGLRSGFLLSQ